MEVSGQLNNPAALPPGEEPRYPLHYIKHWACTKTFHTAVAHFNELCILRYAPIFVPWAVLEETWASR